MNLGMRGAQDMAGVSEAQRQAIGQRNNLAKWHDRKLLDGPPCVLRTEGQGGVCFDK